MVRSGARPGVHLRAPAGASGFQLEAARVPRRRGAELIRRVDRGAQVQRVAQPRARALLSAGSMATPPLGRADRWRSSRWSPSAPIRDEPRGVQGQRSSGRGRRRRAPTSPTVLGVGRELGVLTDARGRLDCAARRPAHAVLYRSCGCSCRGWDTWQRRSGRATGGGPRATPSATHRLRVGTSGRAAVSGVVAPTGRASPMVSPSGAP